MGIAGDEASCKEKPDLVGDCFEVHGRLFVANGTPAFRIWRVGTKRILGVAGGEKPVLPASFLEFVSPTSNLYGDFLVCPLSEARPGEMQSVCIESGQRLVVERLGLEGEPAESYLVTASERHAS